MRAAVFALVVVAACTSSDEIATTTYINKDQHYALEAPRGWEVHDVGGLSQFSSPAFRKHAIVVRVADRPSSLGENKPSTDDAIVGVTEAVLKDLPKAVLASKSVVTGSEVPGVMFELTFAPHRATGRYRRAHAVLVGKTHLYHVIYSAPASESLQRDVFNAIVRSLSEEA